MATKRRRRKGKPTVITLTLADEGSIARRATLLIQRGELAKLYRFEYDYPEDLTAAITSATRTLAALEKFPPVITEEVIGDRVKETASTKATVQPADEEPTVDLPAKSGTVAVKISHLKIVSGDTDAAAYRRATLIGARLIDAGLWQGQSPIGIGDAQQTYAQIQDLDDAALGALSLADIVQVDNSMSPTIDRNQDDAQWFVSDPPPPDDGLQQMTVF